MARVTAYEASDGSLHRDRKAWLRHEANLLVAKELRAQLTADVVKKPVGVDTEVHAANLDAAYDIIVNGIGLNKLRDLFAIQFKPSADEGDDAAGQAGEAGAPVDNEGI